MITGADAEFLFGAEQVMIEARHLKGIASEPASHAGPEMRYHQVILPEHSPVRTAGVWSESLHVTQTDCPAKQRAKTVLEELPKAEMPEHGWATAQLLHQHEARVLVATMIA